MHSPVLARYASTLWLLTALTGCERPTAPTALVFADRPVRVPSSAEGWRDVSVGGAHTCGIRLDGRLYCWGANSSGQLGIAQTRGQCVRGPATCEAAPRAVATAERFRQVSLGERHVCAVTVATE